MTFGSFDYGDTYVSEALIGDMKLVSSVEGWTDYYSDVMLRTSVDGNYDN